MSEDVFSLSNTYDCYWLTSHLQGRLDDILRDECLSYREHPVFSRICVDFETACRILLAHSQIQEHRFVPIQNVFSRNWGKKLFRNIFEQFRQPEPL